MGVDRTFTVAEDNAEMYREHQRALTERSNALALAVTEALASAIAERGHQEWKARVAFASTADHPQTTLYSESANFAFRVSFEGATLKVDAQLPAELQPFVEGPMPVSSYPLNIGYSAIAADFVGHKLPETREIVSRCQSQVGIHSAIAQRLAQTSGHRVVASPLADGGWFLRGTGLHSGLEGAVSSEGVTLTLSGLDPEVANTIVRALYQADSTA